MRKHSFQQVFTKHPYSWNLMRPLHACITSLRRLQKALTPLAACPFDADRKAGQRMDHIPPIVAKLRGTIMINHQIFKIPDFWTDLDILFVHTSYDYIWLWYIVISLAGRPLLVDWWLIQACEPFFRALPPHARYVREAMTDTCYMHAGIYCIALHCIRFNYIALYRIEVVTICRKMLW